MPNRPTASVSTPTQRNATSCFHRMLTEPARDASFEWIPDTCVAAIVLTVPSRGRHAWARGRRGRVRTTPGQIPPVPPWQRDYRYDTSSPERKRARCRLPSGAFAPPCRHALREEALGRGPHLCLELTRDRVVERRHPRRATQRRLRRRGELHRHLRGPGGELDRARQQLVVGHAAPREVDLLGSPAADRLAEEHHRGCGLRAHGPLEQPRVATTRMQTEREEARVETSRFAGDAHVA